MSDKENWWIFTFGSGQKHAGKYAKVYGTFETARKKMIQRHGLKWAFQYSESEWKKLENDPNRGYELETELEVIE